LAIVLAGAFAVDSGGFVIEGARCRQRFNVAFFDDPDDFKADKVDGAGQHVVVSQDGVRTSAWALGYDASSDRWRFAMTGSDADAPLVAAVLSDAPPTPGRWTHLVAAYDVATHRTRLQIDGVVQAGAASVPAGFNATGPVVLGRRLWAGGADGFFKGAVDDVRVYGRLVGATDRELTDALNPQPPAVTFPNGNTAQVGRPLQVTLSGNGDPAVTTVRYSLGAAGLDSTAVLAPAGGQATVTVTPVTAGEVYLFAQAVTGAGWPSNITSAAVQVVATPSLSGTVRNAVAGGPVVGATVTLEPGGTTRITDADGRFAFGELAAGTYTVTATASDECLMPTSVELEITAETSEYLLLYPVEDCPAP
jgi:hypothetical protein